MAYDLPSQQHLKSRTGYMPRYLLWIEARDPVTGVIAPEGIWSGVGNRSFMIDGVDRVYSGFGTAFAPDTFRYTSELLVVGQRVQLSGLRPKAVSLIQQTVLKSAKVALHQALHDPLTQNLIGIERKFVGFVDKAPRETPARGDGGSTITLSLVSKLREMTEPLALQKSHEAQKLRSGDHFRQYGSIASVVDASWGET